MGDLALLPHLLIYSIICSYSYDIMTIYLYFGYNPIWFCFVAQTVLALDVENSFSWLFCLFHITLLLFIVVVIVGTLPYFSGTIKCSGIILYISLPNPTISHFSKEHVWLINCYQSHLFSVGCPVFSHTTQFGVKELSFTYEVNRGWSEQQVVSKKKENEAGTAQETIKGELWRRCIFFNA